MCLSTQLQDLHSKTIGGRVEKALTGGKLDKESRRMNTGIEKSLGYGPPEAPQAPEPVVIGGPKQGYNTSVFSGRNR